MLVTKSSTLQFAKNEAGGKGFHLFLMSQAGLRVPSWVVFGKRYFADFIRQNKLSEKINLIISNFINGSISGRLAEDAICDLILKAQHTPELLNSLEEALSQLPKGMFSVRSSAADEDGSAHSFAGQLSTFLYVTAKEEILKNIKLCWASGFSDRCLNYRKENKIGFDKISVSVVLQKMIDPKSSGVLFTCDPVANKMTQFVVSSVYGVGEGLVSGALDADTFWLNAETGKLEKSDIAEKKFSMRREKDGQCKLVDNSADIQSVPSLSDNELTQLWKLGKSLAETMRRPQDIEWAIESNQLYVLQTRPVTSIDSDLIGYPNLWDNSNITESYGGLTSPLSFSFALRNYKAVYVQFCEVLGIPNQMIKEMDSYLSYMLGSINGRVYYNLFNWYKLVGILPGFKQNRQFMETMMGVSESLTDEIANRIKPHPSWDTSKGKIRIFISGLNFLKYHFTIQSLVNDFLKTFNKDYNRYRAMPLHRMRGDELIRIYSDIEVNMLGRWKAPIINDFLCMVHFGLLRKLTLSWLKKFDTTIQNDLLSGEGGLESAEPMRALQHLTHLVSKNESLRKLFDSTEPRDLMEALNQSSHSAFFGKIQQYIDQFGFRCMSEMKLEEIDLMTDPSYLFVCIKNYLKAGIIAEPSDEHERKVRHTAEAKVKSQLHGWKKWTYFWVLRHARKAVKNRENTRFARTRIYGIARTIFQGIGEELAQLGATENPRDIFWLSIEEVMGIYNGTLPSADLQALIQLRVKSYSQFTTNPDPRILTRGAVYWRNKFIKEIDLPSYEGQDFDLKGLSCCPGVVEGVVKIISSSQDNLELNGEILVADRTDPGWVPLYPSISGLLVERGSLLSHSAIVAREMGIPTIVSIPGLTKILKTGMRIRLDGKAGTVKILDPDQIIVGKP